MDFYTVVSIINRKNVIPSSNQPGTITDVMTFHSEANATEAAARITWENRYRLNRANSQILDILWNSQNYKLMISMWVENSENILFIYKNRLEHHPMG